MEQPVTQVNLALFHKEFDYSAGLVGLGTIESGVEVLRLPGPLKVRIEQIEESQPGHGRADF